MHLIRKGQIRWLARATSPNTSASSNARSDLPVDRYGQVTNLLHALVCLFATEHISTIRGALLAMVKEEEDFYSLLLTELDLIMR